MSDRQRMSDALRAVKADGVAWVTFRHKRLRLVPAHCLIIGLTYVLARRGGYTVGAPHRRKCSAGDVVERAQIGGRWVSKPRARVDQEFS